jgi:PAS domain S-box-containing protein
MGIATKITLLICVIVLASSSAIGVSTYWRFSRALVDQELHELSSLARNKSARFVAQIDALRADVRFLARSPVVEGLIRARHAAGIDPKLLESEGEIQRRMAAVFRECLEAKPYYSQARLIGVDDGGKEIVRVERLRSGGEILVTPEDQLQAKGDEPYFAATLSLAKDNIYLSEINLNREHGRVAEPWMPVVRAAAPVYGPDGRPAAILVINRSVQPLIDLLCMGLEHGHTLLLTNDQGEYLAHPDPARTFAFDFGRTAQIQKDFPKLVDVLRTRDQEVGSVVDSSADGEPTAIGVYKAPLDPADPARFVAFALTAPYDLVVSESTQNGWQSLWISGLLLLVSLVLGYLLSRTVTGPLRQVASAAEAFGRGESVAKLPTRAGDETGVVARALETMISQVRDSQTKLKRRAVELESSRTAAMNLLQDVDIARQAAVDAEQATNNQAARTQAILDNATDAIITITSDGAIESFNSAAEQMFGYAARDVIDKNVKLLMPSPDAEQHDQYLQNYLQTGIAKIIGIGREVVGLRADGSTFPMELSISEVRLEDRRLFTGIVRDVTRRRQAEEQFRSVVEASPSGMVLVNAKGEIALVNSETERLFGYQREELLGQPIEILVPERYRSQHPKYLAGFFQSPSSRAMGAGRDLFGRRKDGSEFPVEIGLSPIESEDGILVLSAIVDITERTRAMLQLTEAHEELEQRAEAIERFNRMLTRSNEELKQFAYVASHDLQEPLRKVTAFCQMLGSEYGDRLDDEARKYIQYAVDGATRMKALVQDLLSYSRVETQGQPLEPTDAGEACVEAIANLAMAIEESAAEVRYDPLPVIDADRAQLVRLFQNLIGNAIKYRGTEPPQIHISAKEVDREIVFRVRDNGIGIEPQYFDRIFVIFQRLHARDEYSGTGIGLAVCKRIVERFNGHIWLESEPGVGSEFFFAVPIRASEPPGPRNDELTHDRITTELVSSAD